MNGRQQHTFDLLAEMGAAPPDDRSYNAAIGNPAMSDVTQILSAIEKGDAQATEQLLPLVHEEFRRLTTQRIARVVPAQDL